MKKFNQIIVIAILILHTNSLFSQNVGINESGNIPNVSAMLDISSTNKGLLIPRISLTGTDDITTISTPETSLLIYNTATVSNVTPGYYYWNGSAWMRLSTGDNLGNHIALQNIVLGSKWLSGDGGNEGIVIDSEGRVGIGAQSPGSYADLYVDGTIPFTVDQGSWCQLTYNCNWYSGFQRYMKNGTAGVVTYNGNYYIDLYPSGTAGSPVPSSYDEFCIISESGIGIGTHNPTNSRLVVDGDGTGNYAGESGFEVSVEGDIYATGIIIANNNVGIGTTNPSVSLDVNGGVKFGDPDTNDNGVLDSDEATAVPVGTVRFDVSADKLQVRTSSAWVDLH